MPYLGDASSGQSVDFLLWTPRVVPLYVDFDLTVDFEFGQRPGTGRYISRISVFFSSSPHFFALPFFMDFSRGWGFS